MASSIEQLRSKLTTSPHTFKKLCEHCERKIKNIKNLVQMLDHDHQSAIDSFVASMQNAKRSFND